MVMFNLMFLDSDSNRVWAYFWLVVSVILSLAGAAILAQVTEVGIVVSGVAGGFFLSFLMNYMLFWRVESTPGGMFLQFLIFYFMILGGILGYEFKDIIVILATSLIGSYLTIRSISVIFGGFVNEFEMNTWIKTGTVPSIPWTMYLYLVLIFILFAFGAFFQMRWRPHRLAFIVPNENVVGLLQKVDEDLRLKR